MQITFQLKKILCELDQNNIYLILVFITSYIFFNLYNQYTDKISPEEKARRFRKSVNYLNKYKTENEEFFMGNQEIQQ